MIEEFPSQNINEFELFKSAINKRKQSLVPREFPLSIHLQLT